MIYSNKTTVLYNYDNYGVQVRLPLRHTRLGKLSQLYLRGRDTSNPLDPPLTNARVRILEYSKTFPVLSLLKNR